MTNEHEASRTLVKSSPELWAECSQAQSLARHLAGSFGEIRITRLDPETAVAWEGEQVSGTVRLEPSGWGTRVTLTAQTVVAEEVDGREEADQGQYATDLAKEPALVMDEVGEEPVNEEVASEEVGLPSPDTDQTRPRRRLLERVRALFRGPEPPFDAEPRVPDGPAEPPDPDDSAESSTPEATAGPATPDPLPEPGPAAPEAPAMDARAVLSAALDSLGQAHHRPFSRA